MSSSTILPVIFDATVAWRRATTYPDASRIEPAPHAAVIRQSPVQRRFGRARPWADPPPNAERPRRSQRRRRSAISRARFCRRGAVAAAIDAQLIEQRGFIVHVTMKRIIARASGCPTPSWLATAGQSLGGRTNFREPEDGAVAHRQGILSACSPCCRNDGEVAERLNAPVLKTGSPARGS